MVNNILSMAKMGVSKGRSLATTHLESKLGKSITGSLLNPVSLNFAASVIPPLLMGGSLSHRLKGAAGGLATTAMLGGLSGNLAPALYSMALTAAPSFPGMMSSLVTRYRSGLDARTSSAIPFSHSTMPMDQALNALSYGQSRMGDLGRGTEFNGSTGNLASMMSARYASR